MVGYARADELPTLSVSPSADSLRNSPAAPYPYSQVYTSGQFILPLDLSYEVDLWGRVRRTVTAAKEKKPRPAQPICRPRASACTQSWPWITSGCVPGGCPAAVVGQHPLAGLCRCPASSPGVVWMEAPRRSPIWRRPRPSSTPREWPIPTSPSSAAQYEHAIAVLIGKPPADFSLPARPLDHEPPPIPPGLPSTLLERRPDIAAAERRMAEANEQIGIARSAYYPSLTLGGAVGLEGHSLDGLAGIGPICSGRSVCPWARPCLTWRPPSRATNAAALANYDAAVASYRQTTLSARSRTWRTIWRICASLPWKRSNNPEAVDSAKNSLQLFTNRYVGVGLTPICRWSAHRPSRSRMSAMRWTSVTGRWSQPYA